MTFSLVPATVHTWVKTHKELFVVKWKQEGELSCVCFSPIYLFIFNLFLFVANSIVPIPVQGDFSTNQHLINR